MQKSYLRIQKPGGGKTTKLIEEAKETLSADGTVILTTFGKKNMEQMKQRMGWLSEEKQKKLRIQTIHSAAWNHLKPKKETNLTTYLFEHDADFGLRFGSSMKQTAGVLHENISVMRGETDDDIAYMELQRLRSSGKTYRDTALQWPLSDKVKRISDILDDGFARGGWDYTYLLEYALKTNMIFEADYVGIDEVNDLTPLQIQICARSRGKKVVFSGDPQQAIYSFNGVDPEHVWKLPGEIDLREESYRVPEIIASYAQKIIDRATDRGMGVIKATKHGGEIIRDFNFDNVVATILKKEESLVLARTNYILERAKERALALGANVPLTPADYLEAELGSMIRKMPPTFRFLSVGAILGPWLPAERYFKRGGKKRLRERVLHDTRGWMPWEEFFDRYGSDQLRDLFAGRHLWYLDSRKFDPMKPVTRFLTIHAAKGLEDKTVVVLRDMGRRVRDGLHLNANEECRLAYVAATRAQEKLVVSQLDPHGVGSPYLA